MARQVLSMLDAVNVSLDRPHGWSPTDLGSVAQSLIRLGVAMAVSAESEARNAAESNAAAARWWVPRPHTPASAQAEHQSIDEKGVVYAPTCISLDAGAFTEDACPMHYDVAAEQTLVVFGATNTAVSLQFSDQALINVARLVNSAVRAMTRARGTPVPEWVGREPE